MSEVSFEQFVTWDNVHLAWQKASKGKRGKAEVAGFEYLLEENLLTLQHALKTQIWRPGGYSSFYIKDPKRRLISAAQFSDRVVHHALCNVIESAFERSFLDESYANRLGKGNHRALDRAQQLSRRFRYVLSLDIRKFFPSIDHAILRQQLQRKIHDHDLMQIADLILSGGRGVLTEEAEHSLFAGDDLIDLMRPKGLPIGNLTSQFWANVYLNPLDHFVKRTLRCKGYVRYVDDMRFFSDSKRELWAWKEKLTDYLSRLRLHVHLGEHPQPVTEGFGFLGFRVFPNHRRLKNRVVFKYQRHLSKLLQDYSEKNATQEQLLDSMFAWNNHASYGNTTGLRKAVFSGLPESISTAARIRYQQILFRQNLLS